MIKIENGNLTIKGSGTEILAELMMALVGYREMLTERDVFTPEEVAKQLEVVCKMSCAPSARRMINALRGMDDAL